MQDKTILVIEDNVMERRLLKRIFHRAGAQVLTAANGLDGLRQLYDNRPDLVILDIVMPELDGWDTLRMVRELSAVPVIIVTALDQDEDTIQGLEIGADDFVCKPISPAVLLARARAAFRREGIPPADRSPDIYQDGRLTINLDRRLVFIDEVPVKLTPKEYRLLAYLLRHAGRVCTFKEILESVWEGSDLVGVAPVHVCISNLRRKLERDTKNPQYIETVHGVGYRFQPQAPRS